MYHWRGMWFIPLIINVSQSQHQKQIQPQDPYFSCNYSFPINGGFIKGNPKIKLMIWGYPHFRKSPDLYHFFHLDAVTQPRIGEWPCRGAGLDVGAGVLPPESAAGGGIEIRGWWIRWMRTGGTPMGNIHMSMKQDLGLISRGEEKGFDPGLCAKLVYYDR